MAITLECVMKQLGVDIDIPLRAEGGELVLTVKFGANSEGQIFWLRPYIAVATALVESKRIPRAWIKVAEGSKGNPLTARTILSEFLSATYENTFKLLDTKERGDSYIAIALS